MTNQQVLAEAKRVLLEKLQEQIKIGEQNSLNTLFNYTNDSSYNDVSTYQTEHLKDAVEIVTRLNTLNEIYRLIENIL